MIKHWRILVAVLLIFAAGLATGRLSARWENRTAKSPNPGWPGERVDFLRKIGNKINLTQAQHDKVEAIVKESRERTHKIVEPMRASMKQEFEEVKSRILAELTEDQRKDFERLWAERRKSKAGPPKEEKRP